MMTSSDHPLPTSQHIKISAGIAVLLALIVLPYIYLIFFIFPIAGQDKTDELGKLLAQQVGNGNAEQIVNKDTLILSVVLHQLTSSGSVAYAAIYSADNQLLAKAGVPSEESSAEFRTYTENITIQNSSAGRVLITLRTNGPMMVGIYSTAQWAWIMFAWFIFLVLITIVWVSYVLLPKGTATVDTESIVTGLQRIRRTLTRATQPITPEELPVAVDNEPERWHTVQSGVLVIEFSNLSTLLQQLNNKTMTKLLEECYANMDMCAKLYNGSLSGWLGKNVVIYFNGSNEETEHYFHAVCCAELIIGLTNYLNERLLKSNLPRIKLHAALHAGDLLTDNNHSISETISIATEICQHADNNQLLISDALYTRDAVAERLLVSEPHILVLESINRPITTYAILDLQPTYRELLTRQIQQLITMKSN